MNFNYYIRSFSEETKTVSRKIFQYWIILDGSGVIEDQGKEYSLTPHAMLELPAGADLPLKISGGRLLTVGVMELEDFYIFQTEIRLISAAQTDYLRQAFYLAMELNGRPMPRKSAVHNAMDHLMFEVITSTSIIINQVNPAVYHLIDDITKKYRDPGYDFTPMIEESGYSPNHFRKLFKDATGITPLSFLHILRIDYAKGLIRRHGRDLSMKEIALRSGFEDPYYFSRLFKKYEKCSPSDYLLSMSKEATS